MISKAQRPHGPRWGPVVACFHLMDRNKLSLHGTSALAVAIISALLTVALAGTALAQQPLFTFAQISDSQPRSAGDQAAFESVLATIADSGAPGALLPYPVDFVLFAGDLVDDGDETADWTSFANTMDTWLNANSIPWRAVPGNHDRTGSGFAQYEVWVGSADTWSMGSATFTGQNGHEIHTGWSGLRFIGLNNTNGSDNTISQADRIRLDNFVAAGVAGGENVFILAHHPHDEDDRMPINDVLETPNVVGYLRGHNSSPSVHPGLDGIANPNIWEARSNSIFEDEGLVYYEVFETDIQGYALELDDNPSQLPSPVIVPLYRPLVPACGSSGATSSPTAAPSPLCSTSEFFCWPAATGNGAELAGNMTADTTYAGGSDDDPLADSLAKTLVFPDSTVNAWSGFSGDEVTYSVNLPDPGYWYLWGRFYYPGASAGNGACSFFASVDDQALQLFGDDCDFAEQWHYDGDGGPGRTGGVGQPLLLGSFAAGPHSLKVEKREVMPIAPRMDVLCLTQNPSAVPSDEEVQVALAGCPTTTSTVTTSLVASTTTTSTLPPCTSAAAPTCAGSCPSGEVCSADTDACSCVAGNITPPAPGGAVAQFQELQTGAITDSTTVSTTASITAVTDNLYLAAVSMKDYGPVSSVSGLGLTWTELVSQCSGRGQTGTSVWWAKGTPSASGVVTAVLPESSRSLVIAVARYSGALWLEPLGNHVEGNTEGLGPDCSGGSDKKSYSLPLDTTDDSSLVYAAVAMRSATHTPGAGFVERGTVVVGSGGRTTSLAVAETFVPAPAEVDIEGSFDVKVDWSVVAVEIHADPLEPCNRRADCLDGNPCTQDSCRSPGYCVHTPVAGSCDDGAFCNGADSCLDGECSVHTGNPCTGGDQCSNMCDENADTCNLPAGSFCDDGNCCTVGQCNGQGSCVNTNSPAGTACPDDGNQCTDNVCNGSGFCTHPNRSGSCDDGVYCNGADSCSAGSCSIHAGNPCTGGADCADTCDETGNICTHGVGQTCTDDGNVCTDDICNGPANCAHPVNTAPCNDGVFCNGADTCLAGSCSVHTGDPCVGGLECADTCNEIGDTCNEPAATVCTDDGNECTDNQCDGTGACAAISRALGSACSDDGNPCTDDICDGAGACTHPVNAAPCDDGVFCNGADTCAAGTCSVHAGDPCIGGLECADTCDELGDTCNEPVATACTDDGNECTENLCDGAGTCLPTGRATGTACIDDGNPCTDDTCDGAGACAHPANVAPCDDGVFCNGADTCADATCSVHTGDPCAGGLECADTCDELDDTCDEPASTACTDDGNECTDDLCDGAGACVAISKPVDTSCNDDGNPCTDDVCDGAAACTHPANVAPCDDGVFCNGADTCANATCSVHTGDPCVGGPECADSCNELVDTCNEPASTACTDDGNECTDDRCDGSGACVATAHPTGTTCIDDGNACTDDTCDGLGTCTHTVNAAPCDDGLFCNGSDTCSDGACSTHAGDPCAGEPECADTCDEIGDTCNEPATTPCTDDGNFCTNDVCDGEGWCLHPVNAAPCDDGLFCNGADTCLGGACVLHAGDPCPGGSECADTCDETGDTCNLPAATPCSDDGNACTVSACDGSGTCAATDLPAGTPCSDDGNVCTDDVCDGAALCTHTSNLGPCDDGLFCNGAETCDADDVCQPGAVPDCDDGIDCTGDACSEGIQSCSHVPDDAVCDDHKTCSGLETCTPDVGCEPTPPVQCIDCGHASEAAGAAPAGNAEPGALTTTDAMVTLMASVGNFQCPLCVCDVDSSGDTTASDALRILRAAVGLPADLGCPTCT